MNNMKTIVHTRDRFHGVRVSPHKERDDVGKEQLAVDALGVSFALILKQVGLRHGRRRLQIQHGELREPSLQRQSE